MTDKRIAGIPATEKDRVNEKEKAEKTIAEMRTEKEQELSELELACSKNFEKRMAALLTEFDYEFYPLTIKTDKGERTQIKYRRIGR
jgi:hypothetical protein